MDIPVYKVDSGLPMPDPIAEWGKMPLSGLEVGDSFLFPIEFRNYVQARASTIKKNKGKEFTVRKQDADSARVWRTK